MWKNIVERDRPQMTIWRMRIACWTPKATNTCTEVVFPLQKWLHPTPLNVTLYVFCLSCYILESSLSLSYSQFFLPKLQHLLTCMFLFHYHGLRCPVCSHKWFRLLVLVDSMICLTHRPDLLFTPTNARCTHQDITAMTCSY